MSREKRHNFQTKDLFQFCFIKKSQPESISLVRKPAPKLQAPAWYQGDFKTLKLSDFSGKYLVLFFYPLDFTFVYPTQNHRIQHQSQINNSEKLAVKLLLALLILNFRIWRRMVDSVKWKSLFYRILTNISRDYTCLIEEGGDSGISFRATYIIDKGIVQHQSVNDLPVGRNPDEYLRLIKAFQFTDTHGEVCPVSWQPGQKTMIPDPKQNNYKEVINSAH